MKKLILLFALLFSLQEAFASGRTIANHWRWSTDQGSIASKNNASWLKPVNVAPVISMPGAYRLRMLTFAEGNYTFEAGDRLILEYREEPQPNSAQTIDANGIIVNNNSSTAGAWTQVLAENPGLSSRAFAVDAGYNDGASGALRDRFYNGTSAANLLYSQEDFSGVNTPVMPARHDDPPTATRRGGVGLSKNSSIGYGDPSSSGALTEISRGGLEVEYRLVATKNAKPGALYYFRLRNTNTAGNGKGTTDSWDYAAGFPSIAISADYNATVNAALPDISVSIPTGFGAYVTGVSRTGVLRVANASATTSTVGPIRLLIDAPTGWTFNIASPASGWTYSAGILETSSVTLAPSTGQNFTYSLVNPNAGFATSFLRATVDRTVTKDGDGANNRAFSAVFKQL
jgi:hypothetical protein